MIAYVFWHTRLADVSAPAYESGLSAFHRSLTVNTPEGFQSSTSCCFEGLPWVRASDVYEDWYLVNDFESLGILNDRAAADRHAETHDHVASYSETGTGSIYALEAGAPVLNAGFVYWFDKPDGASTATFLKEIRPIAESPGRALWRRQLSLGPATEYCIRSVSSIELPFKFSLAQVKRRAWPQ